MFLGLSSVAITTSTTSSISSTSSFSPLEKKSIETEDLSPDTGSPLGEYITTSRDARQRAPFLRVWNEWLNWNRNISHRLKLDRRNRSGVDSFLWRKCYRTEPLEVESVAENSISSTVDGFRRLQYTFRYGKRVSQSCSGSVVVWKKTRSNYDWWNRYQTRNRWRCFGLRTCCSWKICSPSLVHGRFMTNQF